MGRNGCLIIDAEMYLLGLIKMHGHYSGGGWAFSLACDACLMSAAVGLGIFGVDTDT